MAASQKKLTLLIIYSKKAILLLRLLYAAGAIQNYYVLTRNSHTHNFIKVFVTYYKNQPLTKYFKLMSRPSRTFYISYPALRILQKKTYSSIYFVSTSAGLMTHHDAITRRIGGILIGFIFN
jgi:ribosomal protein S8